MSGQILRTGLRILLGLGIVAQAAVTTKIPSFADFPAGPAFQGRAAKPILRTPFQRKFRTQIREQSQPPADFAGHYKIVTWGAGTNFEQGVLVDLRSGAIYGLPFRDLDYGPNFTYEGGDDYDKYLPSSRLLIARGCPESRNCGTYYYEWSAGHFRLLRFAPHGPLLPRP